MHINSRRNQSIIHKEALKFFPDGHMRLSEMAAIIKLSMYPLSGRSLGTKLAYRRICVDFKEGICIRKWGTRDGKVLVKCDSEDRWTYLAWIPKEEII